MKTATLSKGFFLDILSLILFLENTASIIQRMSGSCFVVNKYSDITM